MSFLGWLLGEPTDPGKDRDYHPEEHGWGWPASSRDPKSRDAGSSTTGQTWADLDPDRLDGVQIDGLNHRWPPGRRSLWPRRAIPARGQCPG